MKSLINANLFISGQDDTETFPHSNERAKDLLGIIHTDVCGPLRHVSRQAASYFITFTDDYSRYGYVYLLKHKHELTPPYTPQHNGVSERRNRTLLDMVRSMMNLTTLPLSFWDYALESATRILNMVPTKKVDKTPYELWYEKSFQTWSYLKKDTQRKRWVTISTSHLKTKLCCKGMPEFLREASHKSMKSLEGAVDLEEIQEEEDTTPSEITSNIPQEVEGFEPPQEEVIPIHPMIGQYGMLRVLRTLPPGCKTVGSRWLFKKKTDMDGIVHVYKARLVAKGYTQLYGVDYEETFSPVADIRAIRILISIAAYYDYEIWQMDVKTAFLNGYLDEDIYMVQPEGFVDPNHPRKRFGGSSIYSWNQNFIRDRSKRLIGLCQNAYMDKILKRYKMDNSKRGHIPMQERLDLNKSQGAQTRLKRDDTKSQTGYVFVLNGGAVDWKSSKQSTTAMSATESEYIAASEAAMEAVWIRKFISGLGIVPTINEPLNILEIASRVYAYVDIPFPDISLKVVLNKQDTTGGPS
ncbi:retrotransposon protein, putative, ty1-copia subclass [Tanacetum coccineum]